VRVWADRIGLREVFANLISNALRHLDKDPGRVTIEYRDDGQEHVFCVCDNGAGIAPEIESRLFEPFVRGPQQGRHCGRGLGLHFVRTIVSQHGGRVWVESAQGSGSRFYFSVPREPVAVDQPRGSGPVRQA
jgi:signal transduction histidine kinase